MLTIATKTILVMHDYYLVVCVLDYSKLRIYNSRFQFERQKSGVMVH